MMYQNSQNVNKTNQFVRHSKQIRTCYDFDTKFSLVCFYNHLIKYLIQFNCMKNFLKCSYFDSIITHWL